MSIFHPDVEFPRDAPAQAAASAEPPATAKQVSYLTALLTERDTRGTKYEGHLAAPVLTKAQAHQAISELVEMPKIHRDSSPTPVADLQAAHPFTKGYFTVVHADGTHVTYRFATQKDDADFLPGQMIISRLVGKNNEADYVRVGHVTTNGYAAKIWKRHQGTGIEADLDVIQAHMDAAGVAYTRTYAVDARPCYRCHRLLTTPESIERGLGEECAKKMGL